MEWKQQELTCAQKMSLTYDVMSERQLITFLLLNKTCPVLANSVDPDQLASEEANWSGSALFVIKYVNFYQKPRSSNLIGWKLEVGVASLFSMTRVNTVRIPVTGQESLSVLVPITIRTKFYICHPWCSILRLDVFLGRRFLNGFQYLWVWKLLQVNGV